MYQHSTFIQRGLNKNDTRIWGHFWVPQMPLCCNKQGPTHAPHGDQPHSWQREGPKQTRRTRQTQEHRTGEEGRLQVRLFNRLGGYSFIHLCFLRGESSLRTKYKIYRSILIQVRPLRLFVGLYFDARLAQEAQPHREGEEMALWQVRIFCDRIHQLEESHWGHPRKSQ